MSQKLDQVKQIECNTCGTFKPLSEYYQRKNGWYSYKCKSCTKEARRKNHDPLKKKDYDLKRLYGISLEEYTNILEEQEGGCAICGKTVLEDTLCVDHDHDTGTVRGLLCHGCNRGIGLLQDSSDNLMAAAEYLKNYDK